MKAFQNLKSKHRWIMLFTIIRYRVDPKCEASKYFTKKWYQNTVLLLNCCQIYSTDKTNADSTIWIRENHITTSVTVCVLIFFVAVSSRIFIDNKRPASSTRKICRVVTNIAKKESSRRLKLYHIDHIRVLLHFTLSQTDHRPRTNPSFHSHIIWWAFKLLFSIWSDFLDA